MVTALDANGIPILGQPAAAPASDELPPTFVTQMRFGPIVVNHPTEGPVAGLVLQFGLPTGQPLPPLILVADDEALLQLPDLLRKAIREGRRAAADAIEEAKNEEPS